MLSERIAKLPRGRALLASCVAAVGAATGCAADPPERVADRKCPTRPPAVYAALDVSDSARSSALVAERLAAVESLLTDTAVCGGRVRVVAFTGSAAATEVLLEQDLAPEGATRRAQLRRVPALVDEAVGEVRAKLPAAADRLPPGGTDVLAQLALAGEFRTLTGTTRPLQVVVWSDGIASAPVDLNTADLDVARASSLAEGVAPPDLSGADVTFAGIGRPAGALPPTSYVDALKAFYRTACERSHATCTVASGATAGRFS